MLQNSKDSYGLVAQGLHWLTALFILTLLPLGVYMHELPQSSPAEIEDKVWLYSLHKTIGMTALVVAILRVLWALRSKKPALLNPDHKLESMAAEVAHWLLYISMIAVPVFGWLHHAAVDGFAPIWGPYPQEAGFVPKDPALAAILGGLHAAFAMTLFVTILAHVGGAMKHFVIDRDQTLQRMIPFAYRAIQVLPDMPHARAPIAVAVLVYATVAGGTLIAVRADSHNHDDHSHAGQQVVTAGPAAAETGAVVAGGWVVDHSKSSLAISVTQMGALVSGKFANWSADIRFDPADPAAASIQAHISLASLALGSVSDQAKGKDYLDVATYQQAVFTASGFTSLGGNKWQTDGTLDLHGAEQPVQLQFTLDIADGHAVVLAEADLNRTAFGIGGADEGTVLQGVKVVIDLEADLAP